jgi:hypothetical protein
MALRVIDGGRATAVPARKDNLVPGKQDIAEEADRRLQAIGYGRWRAREAATGILMPREVKYLGMQIGFVAQALSALASVPQDFRSDIYWPASEATAWTPSSTPGT